MAWITPTFNAADFTAYSGSWTVGSGNVNTNAYKLLDGDTMVWMVELYGTSVSAPTIGFKIKIPAGKIVAKANTFAAIIYDDGMPAEPGQSTVCVPISGWAGDQISIYRLDGKKFRVSSGNTHIYVHAEFEVQ